MGAPSDPDVPWPTRYALSKLAYRIDANERRLDRLEPVVNQLADKDRLQSAMTQAVKDLGTARWTRREKVLGGIVAFAAVMGDVAAVVTLVLH